MRILVTLLAFLVASAANAQQSALLADGAELRLWSGDAPGAIGSEARDVPTLTAYLPFHPREPVAAVVILPGGGYGMLADHHEGRQIANYFNAMGIAAFVLKYRLGPRYRHPVEVGDALRAIRLVRARSATWKIDPFRIGIMGFSAGGHLAMTASTRFEAAHPESPDEIERSASRPDFSILGYPVISMTAPWTHQGSKRNLLGDAPDERVARELSGELVVTESTPPTFIFQTNEDDVVPAENSLHYALALRKARVPVELHLFEKGAHGVGLATADPALAPWSTLLTNWLRARGVLR